MGVRFYLFCASSEFPMGLLTPKFSCIMGFLGDVGLLLFLLVYSLLGATIFTVIEAPAQLSRIQAELKVANQSIVNSSEILCSWILDSFNTTNETSYCSQLLQDALWNSFWTYNREERGQSTTWTFGAAAVFAGTVYTTIGYGNLAPVTVLGRSITMIYALLGIPLTLVIVARCGFHASVFMNWLWQALTYSRCHGEAYMEERAEKHFPIALALLLTLGWLFASSAMFLIWEEDWDYFTCFYFSFISLTTIGLGDVIPKKPETMLINFVFILLGLSLLSMCINLIQTKIEAIATEVMDLIRSRYRDSQLRTSSMNSLECDAEVDELLSKHSKTSKFMAALVKRKHREEIKTYWEEKAKMVLAATQTNLDTRNAACGPRVDTTDSATQDFSNVTSPSTVSSPVTHASLMSSYEFRYNQEVDEFRAIVRRLDLTLRDCRELLRQ